MSRTPLDELNYSLSQMDIEIEAVFDYATLLGVMTAGPDAETAMEGICRLLGDIRIRTEAIRSFHDDMREAVKRLASAPAIPASETNECA